LSNFDTNAMNDIFDILFLTRSLFKLIGRYKPEIPMNLMEKVHTNQT